MKFLITWPWTQSTALPASYWWRSLPRSVQVIRLHLSVQPAVCKQKKGKNYGGYHIEMLQCLLSMETLVRQMWTGLAEICVVLKLTLKSFSYNFALNIYMAKRICRSCKNVERGTREMYPKLRSLTAFARIQFPTRFSSPTWQLPISATPVTGDWTSSGIWGHWTHTRGTYIHVGVHTQDKVK